MIREMVRFVGLLLFAGACTPTGAAPLEQPDEDVLGPAPVGEITIPTRAVEEGPDPMQAEPDLQPESEPEAEPETVDDTLAAASDVDARLDEVEPLDEVEVTLERGCGPCCAAESLWVDILEGSRPAAQVADPIASRYRPDAGSGWRACIGNVDESTGWSAEIAFDLTPRGRAKNITVAVDPPQAQVDRCLTRALSRVRWPQAAAGNVVVRALYSRLGAFGYPG